jgi:hypothetical protein
MPESMHDIRTKVPTQTLSVIQALEMATGETMAEIVRVWIIEAAEKELHKATIVTRVMRGEGSDGAGEGKDP